MIDDNGEGVVALLEVASPGRSGLVSKKKGRFKSECALADANMKAFAIRKDLVADLSSRVSSCR